MILSLNANNDIYLDGNSIATVKDGEEVVQQVRSRLLFYLEEWFLDTTVGLPYFQEFFKKPADLAGIESRIKAEIIQTDGILNLLSFEYNFDRGTRKLTVNFEAETIYGDVRGDISVNRPAEIENKNLLLSSGGKLLLSNGQPLGII